MILRSRAIEQRDGGWVYENRVVTKSYECLDFLDLSPERLKCFYDELKNIAPPDIKTLHGEGEVIYKILVKAESTVKEELSKHKDKIYAAGCEAAAELFDPNQQTLRLFMLRYHAITIELDKIAVDIYGNYAVYRPPLHRENPASFIKKNRSLFAEGLPDKYVIPDKNQTYPSSSWKSWRAPFENNLKYNFSGSPYSQGKTGYNSQGMSAEQIEALANKIDLNCGELISQQGEDSKASIEDAIKFLYENPTFRYKLNNLNSGSWPGNKQRQLEVVRRFLCQGGDAKDNTYYLIDGWTGLTLHIDDAVVDHKAPNRPQKNEPQGTDTFENFVITDRRVNLAKNNCSISTFVDKILRKAKALYPSANQ